MKNGTWKMFTFEDLIFLICFYRDMWWFYMSEFPPDGKIIYRCSMPPFCPTSINKCASWFVSVADGMYFKSFSQILKYLCSGLYLLLTISAISLLCFLPPVLPLSAPHPFHASPTLTYSWPLSPILSALPIHSILFSWIICSFTPCVLNCISFCLDSFLSLNCFSPTCLLSKLIFYFQYRVQCWHVQCLINIC